MYQGSPSTFTCLVPTLSGGAPHLPINRYFSSQFFLAHHPSRNPFLGLPLAMYLCTFISKTHAMLTFGFKVWLMR